MECVNFYKLTSIITIYITHKYKELFKQRFREESGGAEWKNNFGHGKFLMDQINSNSEFNKILVDEELKIIESGNLEQFHFLLLSKLFIFSKYHVINKDRVEKENLCIQNILLIFNNQVFSIKTFKIGCLEYAKIREFITINLEQIFNGDDSGGSNNNNKNTNGINVREDLEYFIDSLQLANKKNIYQINEQNEQNANKMKQTGNEYYSNGEYSEAMRYYDNALQLENLSTCTKSVIQLNLSLAILGVLKLENGINTTLNKSPDQDDVLRRFMAKNEDRDMYLLALGTSNESIRCRPHWSKPYYRLACIYSKFTSYSRAKELFEASLFLDNSEENKKLIKSQLEQIEIKMSIINKSIKSNGERDFGKEAMLMLNDIYKFDQIIKEKFKDKNLQDQESKLLLSNPMKNVFAKHIAGVLPKKKIDEILIMSLCIDFGLQYKADKAKRTSYFEKLVGNGTEFATPYYILAIQSDDPKFKMAMMIKASTLPVPFHQIKDQHKEPVSIFLLFNYTVALSCEYLGMVYLHGLLDNDIDYDRAKYYFEKSIEIDQKLNPKYLKTVQCTGFSYLALGHMYNNGKFNIDGGFGRKSKEKAIEIWTQGSKIDGIIYHDTLVNEKQLNQKSSSSTYSKTSTSTTTTSNYSNVESLHDSFTNYIAFSRVNEILETRILVDVNQIREEMNQGFPYAKQVFEIYATVSKFIESFKKESTKPLSLEQRTQLVKPVADLFCQLDMIDNIHFPITILFPLEEFMKNLIKDAPNNEIVAVAYIGTFRFDSTTRESTINELFQISNKFSSSLLSTPDKARVSSSSFFKNKYLQALMYYKCYYGVMIKDEFYPQYKTLLKCSLNGNKDISFIFNFYLLSMLLFFKSFQDKLSKDEILQLYNNAIYYISTLSKDHPILSKYHTSLAGILSRFYSNSSSSNESHKKQILSHYQSSLNNLNNLKFRNNKRGSTAGHLKALLCIPHFRKLLSNEKINQTTTIIEKIEKNFLSNSSYPLDHN